MNNRIEKLTAIGMLCAIAYIVMFVCRIPVVLFLKYEPKDVIITLGGLIWGPTVAVFTSFVVSLIEMVTVSDNGIYGLIMNIVSTCSFAFVASLIYKKKRTLVGAIVALVVGSLSMVATMTLWNIVIAPFYMKIPREAVMPLIPTMFIPFNLLKAGLNTGLILLLYKPVTSALKMAQLIGTQSKPQKNNTILIFIISIILIITCILSFMLLSNSNSKDNTDSETVNNQSESSANDSTLYQYTESQCDFFGNSHLC